METITIEIPKYIDVEFSVSMDDEAKRSGDNHEVKTRILMDEDCAGKLLDGFRKSKVIELQSPVRKHWDKFTNEGFPKEVRWDENPFALGRRTRTVIVQKPVTDNDVENYIITKLSQSGLQHLVSTGGMPPKDIAEYWK